MTAAFTFNNKNVLYNADDRQNVWALKIFDAIRPQ